MYLGLKQFLIQVMPVLVNLRKKKGFWGCFFFLGGGGGWWETLIGIQMTELKVVINLLD